MKNFEKPPVGIMPRWLHDGRRVKELKGAILQSMEAGYTIAIEWVEEYNELTRRHRDEETEILHDQKHTD